MNGAAMPQHSRRKVLASVSYMPLANHLTSTYLSCPLFLVAYPVDDLQVRHFRAAAAGERQFVVDVQEVVRRAEGLPAERAWGLDSPRVFDHSHAHV